MMNNMTVATMLATFYDAASKTIFKMLDSLKVKNVGGNYYDYQAKKLLTPDGKELYIFSFAMITPDKKLRDEMWKTIWRRNKN